MRTGWLCIVLTIGMASAGIASAAATAPRLVYSDYLRQNFTPNAIAADSSGNIYVAGSIALDPTTSKQTALVMKLSPLTQQYFYEVYLGGLGGSSVSAIALDSAGNAYIAGLTSSPDFPLTPGGALGTPAGSVFIAKLNPTGTVLYSDRLPQAATSALAIAATPAGQAILTGLSQSAGFPTTPGAYTVPDSTNQPYLLEIDPTGMHLVFSATGIGGSALALDSSGDIYVAGTTTRLDYPTTPGTYQSPLPASQTCLFPCQLYFQGPNQYVTKVDPTGSKLIYSTGLSNGNAVNAGLAVDAAGNAYVTGVSTTDYPFTVAAPAVPPVLGAPPYEHLPASPFLSKLDPAGQNLLFSVPVGGAGVQVDVMGSVYVGGRYGYRSNDSFAAVAAVPALQSVPSACLPDPTNSGLGSAYTAQVDAASGSLIGMQYLGGADLIPSGVALAGSTLWVAGPTPDPGVPFTTNALVDSAFGATVPLNLGAGAYLGGVDFSQLQPPDGTPQIGCLLDGADFSPLGPAAPNQIVALFGNGLGPAVGVNAPDNATTSLAGVAVCFGENPATLLYVSSTQINFVVPPAPVSGKTLPCTSVGLQVSVNGVRSVIAGSVGREMPAAVVNPHLFMSTPGTPLAFNADGSVNSSTNPALAGSILSMYVNGLAPNTPASSPAAPDLYSTNAWAVADTVLVTPFVYRVDLRIPASGLPAGVASCSSSECSAAPDLRTLLGADTVPVLPGNAAVYVGCPPCANP